MITPMMAPAIFLAGEVVGAPADPGRDRRRDHIGGPDQLVDCPRPDLGHAEASAASSRRIARCRRSLIWPRAAAAAPRNAAIGPRSGGCACSACKRDDVEVVLQDHVLLGREVTEERRRRDLGRGSDLLDGGRGVALLPEKPERVLPDGGTRPGLLALAQAAGLAGTSVMPVILPWRARVLLALRAARDRPAAGPGARAVPPGGAAGRGRPARQPRSRSRRTPTASRRRRSRRPSGPRRATGPSAPAAPPRRRCRRCRWRRAVDAGRQSGHDQLAAVDGAQHRAEHCDADRRADLAHRRHQRRPGSAALRRERAERGVEHRRQGKAESEAGRQRTRPR